MDADFNSESNVSPPPFRLSFRNVIIFLFYAFKVIKGRARKGAQARGGAEAEGEAGFLLGGESNSGAASQDSGITI